MVGRKPVPVAMRLLRGNPGRRAIPAQPPIPAGIPSTPDYLGATAREEWDRVAAILGPARVLTAADRAALAAYCVAYERWVEAEARVRELGVVVKSPKAKTPMQNPFLSIANAAMQQMVKLATEFGMTPSSRARVGASGAHTGEDPLEAFTNRKRA